MANYLFWEKNNLESKDRNYFFEKKIIYLRK